MGISCSCGDRNKTALEKKLEAKGLNQNSRNEYIDLFGIALWPSDREFYCDMYSGDSNLPKPKYDEVSISLKMSESSKCLSTSTDGGNAYLKSRTLSMSTMPTLQRSKSHELINKYGTPSCVFQNISPSDMELLRIPFVELRDIDDTFKNTYEENHIINKNYVMEMVDTFQDMRLQKDWTLICDKETYKCWMANNGSWISKTNPFLKWEFNFPKEFEFEDIVNAVSLPELRILWDRDIKQIDIEKHICEDSWVLRTTYQNYNLTGTIELVEKQLNFFDEKEGGNNLFVSYISSVPNTCVAKTKEFNRVTTLF